MIWILFLSNIAFFLKNYYRADKDFFHPSVLFTFTFTLFTFCCCIANLYMGIDIGNISTYVIITIGNLLISLCGWSFRRTPLNAQISSKEVESIKVSPILLLFAIAMILITIYSMYHYIIDFASQFGVGGSFTDCVVQFKIIMTFADADSILLQPPTYLHPFMTFSAVFGYVFLYLYVREKVLLNHTNILYLSILILYLMFSLMGGARSDGFRYITAYIFLWYYFLILKNGIEYNKILLMKMFFIGFFLIFLMVGYLFVTGRNDGNLKLDYIIEQIFIYAGAPIFNLDHFLSEMHSPLKGIWGESTFGRLINWIGVKFDISNFRYAPDSPFMTYQNYEMGNVYTTYYSFYYDFNFIGVIVLTFVLAVCCCAIYKNVIELNIIEPKVHFLIIVYAYLTNDIIMLPFSNRFYETIANPASWYLVFFGYAFIKYIDYNNDNEMKKMDED